MINGAALSWSAALHAAVAAAAMVLADEPRGRHPLAYLSVFDAEPLPLVAEGWVAPVAEAPVLSVRPCPRSRPRDRPPRLVRPVDVADAPASLAACVRIAADGRVDAIGFRRDTGPAARGKLIALAGTLRFVPATRDGVRVSAWQGIAVHRRADATPAFGPNPPDVQLRTVP